MAPPPTPAPQLAASVPASNLTALTLASQPSSASVPKVMGPVEYVLASQIIIASLIAGGIAIFVGSLTFRGVKLSLTSAQVRMKEELEAAAVEGARDRQHTADEAAKERQHATEEASKERLMQVRKTVYMKVIDDFMATLAMFGRLPLVDMDVTPNFEQALLDLGASVNKTWLLSEVNTTFKARELYARMNEVYKSLMLGMPALQAIKRDISDATKTCKTAEAERDRLVTALRDNKNFNGNDKQVFAGLMQSRDVQLKSIASAKAEIFKARQEHALLARQHGQRLLAHLGDLMNHVQDVMLAARIELGLTGDNDVLRRQTVDMQERARKIIEDLVNAADGT